MGKFQTPSPRRPGGSRRQPRLRGRGLGHGLGRRRRGGRGARAAGRGGGRHREPHVSRQALGSKRSGRCGSVEKGGDDISVTHLDERSRRF